MLDAQGTAPASGLDWEVCTLIVKAENSGLKVDTGTSTVVVPAGGVFALMALNDTSATTDWNELSITRSPLSGNTDPIMQLTAITRGVAP